MFYLSREDSHLFRSHLGRLSDNIEQPARSFYANSKVE